MFLTLFISCGPAPAPATTGRWPLPGDVAVVEVSAAVGADGHATAWSAAAWSVGPEAAPVSGGGCSPLPEVGLGPFAAVDVSAPAAIRLSPLGDGQLRASGPLSAYDARWQVGDVALLRVDGSRVGAAGAIRFGDAPQVASIRALDDGDVAIRWVPVKGERFEVDVTNAAGTRLRCAGGPHGILQLPWSSIDPAHPVVTVRAVRETVTQVPNEAVIRVRAVLERTLSVDEPIVSERPAVRPPPKRGTWGPRRVLRVRPFRG